MRRTIAAVVLALAIAGCTSPPPQIAPGPTAPTDRAGAPAITSPRELSTRASDPCRSLLSPLQIRQLDYELPGQFRVNVLGDPTCTWREEKAGRRSSASVVLGRDLLVETYRNRFLPVFRELRIEGLPAVDIMSSTQAQTCTTTVGVADGQSLELNTSVGGGADGVRDGDPCAEGHRVAEAIISTLPPR